MKRPSNSSIAAIIVLAALVAYPFAGEHSYITYTLFLIFMYSVVGLFLNLLIGYTGVYFIAPMIPYAVGGYTSGLLALSGIDPILGILAGSVMAAGSSLAFSLLSMRLRGAYMALYSLVFTLLFQQIVSSQDIAVLLPVFRGGASQYAMPDIALGGFQWRFGDGLAYYYLGLFVIIVSALLLKRILDSRLGMACKSIRVAEVYASTLGVSIFRTKIIVFLIAFFFTGLVGGILTVYYGAIGLGVLDVGNIPLFLLMVLFGGLGSQFGPIVGALVVVPLNNYLAAYGAYRLLAWGLAIVVVMQFAPMGVVGKIKKSLKK